MGGAGGGGGPTIGSEDMKRQIRKTEAQVAAQGFETQLAEKLQDFLKEYNSRDTQLAHDRLGEILNQLGKDLEGSFETLFGGSVAKHTYVDGLSDVDSLLIVNKNELANSSPQDVLKYVSGVLTEFLKSEAKISAGDLAVTVEYSDGMQIQLLPALKTATGIKIPALKTKDWSEIVRPKRFSETLTKRNIECGNKLIPTIKLAKVINDKLPEQQQLTGYHIESMAIEAFSGYAGTNTTSSMLPHFFEKAATLVLSPLKDKTGQSRRVDDYLGSANSPERHRVGHLLNRICRRMRNATASGSLEQWEALFDE